MTRKNYVSIDICRYICALFIVIIHTRPFAGLSPAADMISADITARLAVPFFFMTAGYFFINRLPEGKAGLFRCIMKYLRVYLIWSLFYYLIDFVQWGRRDLSAFVKKCISDFFIAGSREHLWFMTALIFSMVLTFLFFRAGCRKLLLPVSAVLYTAGCLGRAYYAVGIQIPVLRQLYTWSGYLTFSRFFFTGFPYFSAGCLITLIRDRAQERKNRFFILFFIFSLIVWASETVFLLRMRWAYNLITTFGNYLLSAAAILLLLRFPMENHRRLGSLCRTLSRFTYYSHMFFISLMGHGLMILFSVQVSGTWKFLFTLAMTFLGGLFIEKTDSKVLKALI